MAQSQNTNTDKLLSDCLYFDWWRKQRTMFVTSHDKQYSNIYVYKNLHVLTSRHTWAAM